MFLECAILFEVYNERPTSAWHSGADIAGQSPTLHLWVPTSKCHYVGNLVQPRIYPCFLGSCPYQKSSAAKHRLLFASCCRCYVYNIYIYSYTVTPFSSTVPTASIYILVHVHARTVAISIPTSHELVINQLVYGNYEDSIHQLITLTWWTPACNILSFTNSYAWKFCLLKLGCMFYLLVVYPLVN